MLVEGWFVLRSWSNSCILGIEIGWPTSGRWDCLNLLGRI